MVVVSSLQAGKGRLKLTENGQLIADVPITFQQGKNRYDLPMELKTPGYLEYQATIEPEEGHFSFRSGPVGFVLLRAFGRR